MTDRPRTFEQWMAINPRLVATECSPVHIEYLIRDAQREIERLRAALKPFADQAAEFDSPVDGLKGDVPDDYYQECSHHTIGDLRTARKALEPKP